MVFLNDLFVKLSNVHDYKFIGIDLVRLILALLFFIFIFLFRRFIRKSTVKILKSLTSKIPVPIGDDIIKEMNTPLKLFFLALAVWISFYILGIEKVFAFINKAERIILIFIITWAIYRALNVFIILLRTIVKEKEKKLDNYIIVFGGNTVKTLVIIMGILMILQEFGYNVTSIIAGLGIGGLAFALASKDFVANIFGFITIFLDKPFTVGDWIVTPDIEGTVEDIWLRCTKVRTFDEALVTIPNALIASKPIINRSIMRKRRITFKLGITCSNKSGQVNELCSRIREMLANHHDINNDVIYVYFTEFAESSYNLFLYFFTNTTVWQEYLEIHHDVNLKIMNILEELGMEVAYPSRSIYMENIPLEIKTPIKPEINNK